MEGAALLLPNEDTLIGHHSLSLCYKYLVRPWQSYGPARSCESSSTLPWTRRSTNYSACTQGCKRYVKKEKESQGTNTQGAGGD